MGILNEKLVDSLTKSSLFIVTVIEAEPSDEEGTNVSIHEKVPSNDWFTDYLVQQFCFGIEKETGSTTFLILDAIENTT